ncbi:MAG: DUF72 domain-containing protein [Deltaproteobacteria bacterium]|nr:DUF72 domain-containing protein [Deltaproteobacteria bacterium]
MIHIGTSGYSYTDWKGYFYPESLQSDAFLSYYAKYFSAVELNFSYYRMPTAKQMETMVQKSDGKLLFAVKAHQMFTHQRTPVTADFKQFSQALAPLLEANCLGGVLLQFPNSFLQNELNRKYLRDVSKRFSFPLVAEFRNGEWAADAIYKWLSKLGIGFCCVDEPQLPGLLPRLHVCTSNIAYVRFHGRNRQKWYQHNHAYERYDYKYTAAELSEWVSPIQQLDRQAERTMVFFNNHFQAKAVDSARQLSNMLHLCMDQQRKE